MRCSLRSKLTGSFALTFLWILAVQSVNMYASVRIERQMESTIQRDVKAANILAEIRRKGELLQANALLHVRAKSAQDMRRYELEISKGEREITALLDTYENTCQSQTELDKLARFRLAWDTYSRIRDERVLPTSRMNHKEEALALASENGPGGMAAQAVFEELQALQNANSAAAAHRMEQANQEHQRSRNLLRFASPLAITAGLVFGVYQSFQISKAMNLVSNVAQLLASGDFDWSVTVKTGDEIELIAESINRIGRRMKKALAARREAIEQWQRATRERQLVERMLAAEKERLIMTLHLINDGIIVTDTEGKITLINKIAETLTGWTQEKARGKPIDEVFTVFDAETHKSCNSPVQQVWGNSRMVNWPNCALLLARDGTEQMIVYRSAPVYDPDGSIIGSVLSFHECQQVGKNETGAPRYLKRDTRSLDFG